MTSTTVTLMKAGPKLSADERRAAIIQAVRRVFADKGFHGTTTRELASAAGVSEALLFKHFPNKEALFLEMLRSCTEPASGGEGVRSVAVLAPEPSTRTLVLLVHSLFAHIVGGVKPGDDEAIEARLVLRSLLEDGEFARLLLGRFAAQWLPLAEASLRAAAVAGDLIDDAIAPTSAGWFTHHLAVSVLIHLLPAASVVEYAVSREQLVEQAVRYALRGVGLRDEAIKRHYDPKTLSGSEPA